MTDDNLAELTTLFERAAATTRIVRECRAAMLRSLEAEGKELPENGWGILVEPMDTLRRLQDVRTMINTTLEAMSKTDWPASGEHGHYQRFLDERKQAQAQPRTQRVPLVANVGNRPLVGARVGGGKS